MPSAASSRASLRAPIGAPRWGDEPIARGVGGRSASLLSDGSGARIGRRCREEVPLTLGQLAATIAVLGLLGLTATRIGLSSIPAYLLAGLLLGPNEPKALSLVRPSEVTHFVADLGIVFLLFFLGLEFTLGRLARTRNHVLVGGGIDLAINAGLGLAIGFAAFRFSFAALIVAAAVYISSSAITVKGLIEFKRLADDETDLVLAILVGEDLVIAFVLGFAAGGGATLGQTLTIAGKALGFIVLSLAASSWLRRPIDRLLTRLPREFFLLAVFAFLTGMAATARALDLSEAIGALMAGVVLSETSAREEIEERFFSFRDVFAALFFFVFGLSIDVASMGDVAWILIAATVVALAGKTVGGYTAGLLGGLNRRQSFNAGVALIAHGEFTIIIAQLASANTAIARGDRLELVAFAGLYVLVTATIGLALMKQSKALGRRVFALPSAERS